MDGLLIPIFVAGAVATFVWGLTVVFSSGARKQREKLTERLSNEGGQEQQNQAFANNSKSIVLQTAVEGVPAFLAQQPFVQRLNRKVTQTYPTRTLGKFLMIALIAGAVFGGISLVISTSKLVGLLGFAVGFYAPFVLMNMKRSKRQRMIALQLPEALDFLTRVLRAGHSLSIGLQMMGEELPHPLCEEFQKAYDQHSLGVSLEDSLREAATRIDSSDFGFFVTAVLIQRTTGGDLSEVLKNIGSMIRGRVRLAQHVKAKTAEGRFTGYVLVAFPAIMFMLSYYMNPGYAGVLIRDPGGQMLLGVAVGLQLLGLIAIKKITTVKV
jgi:tight adherence protein B